MNVQAQMSGQTSGQVSNQLSQQNGNNLPNSIFGIHPAARIFIREQIKKMFDLLKSHTLGGISKPERQAHPVGEPQKQRYKDFAKRLEECLAKSAQSKEDYININTLESRLIDLLKRAPAKNNNQRNLQLVNPSSSIGTMIPTPGMSHSGNSNLMASSVNTMMNSSTACDSIAPTTVNTGGLLPTNGIQSGAFSTSDGNQSNGYQQSQSNYSISSGGSMSSMGVQRMTSQMIPTPGFNNNNTNPAYVSKESSNNAGGFSSVESIMLSQPLQQKARDGSGFSTRLISALSDLKNGHGS